MIPRGGRRFRNHWDSDLIDGVQRLRPLRAVSLRNRFWNVPKFLPIRVTLWSTRENAGQTTRRRDCDVRAERVVFSAPAGRWFGVGPINVWYGSASEASKHISLS